VDTIDREFLPTHCPHRQCKYFPTGNQIKWFLKAGTHSTQAHGCVQRFRCKGCGRTFSRQTFDLHYFSKRRLDWENFRWIVRQCSSDRAKSRELGVSPTTIANKTHRLSQWSLSVQHRVTEGYKFSGRYCADGFETFTHTQYHPGHLNILVGAHSLFVFNWDYATIRRKGRMTPEQKAKRDEWERKWKPAEKTSSPDHRRTSPVPSSPEEKLSDSKSIRYRYLYPRDDQL